MLTTRRPVRTLLCVGAFIILGAACGASGDDASSPDAPAATTTTEPPTTTTTNPPTTATTTTTTTTTTAPPAPTTTVSATRGISVPIPEGTFSAGPTDLYVLALDGDLEWWPETLGAPPTRTSTVIDYPNPFGPVNEGPGPNVIDHVAGEINGAIVFGDCCEPIAGSILAATTPDVVDAIAGGYTPTRSPTGDLLGAANDDAISQTATDGDGEGLARQLNVGPDDAYLNVADLTWTNSATLTGADDHLVLLGWTNEGGWSLYDVDRATLELTEALELGIAPVHEAPDTDVHFAGTGPGAEIVVAESNATTTRLRYFAPTTLTELPQLERSLPASATSIRVSQDDLLWVDDTVLYFLRRGTSEPIRLGSDVIAAWAP